MRILVVTNLYPPHHIGGYELGCRDIVDKLQARGHDVRVLTSTFRQANQETPPGETGVGRVLQFYAGPAGVRASQVGECRILAKALAEFSPSVVYFFNQAGLCRWLPVLARLLDYPVAFFLSDTTFVSWKVASWLSGPAEKNALIRAVFGAGFLVKGLPVIRHQPCHFASEFLRKVAEQNTTGFSAERSIVSRWGIELSQFITPPRERRPVRRLLYAGQLIPQKGVHTALAALARLVGEPAFADCQLNIAGGGMNPEYEQSLRERALQPDLAGHVHFLGRVPRADLPRIYAEHDALVFPSEWDEPFAITPLEAMACGLPVVGTLTGGSGELFRNRETAMTFRAGDAADCARALRELCADDALREYISQSAQAVVRKKHTLGAMVDAIEASLQKIAAG